jgi:cell division transport system ATP-binding protein
MKRRVIELVSGQIVRDERQGGYQTQAIPVQGFGLEGDAPAPATAPVTSPAPGYVPLASAPPVTRFAPPATNPPVSAPAAPSVPPVVRTAPPATGVQPSVPPTTASAPPVPPPLVEPGGRS